MSRRRWIVLGVVVVAATAVCLYYARTRRDTPLDTPVSFRGDSTGLKQTVVVSTLDEPIPEGKNAVWCATFQMAWNRLAADVVREPIRIAGAEEVVKRLIAMRRRGAKTPFFLMWVGNAELLCKR